MATMTTAYAPGESENRLEDPLALTDSQFNVADWFTDLLDAHPHRAYSVPKLAKKARISVPEAALVLEWMVIHRWAIEQEGHRGTKYSASRPLD